jgi:transcriptional regulator with XRE-family HTH domain
MKQPHQFGAAFRAVRLARGLTQEDFTHYSGRTYVGELERGIKQPTLQKIDDLAVPLEVHPLTLIALAYLKQWDMLCCEDLLAQVRGELGEIIKSKSRV